MSSTALQIRSPFPVLVALDLPASVSLVQQIPGAIRAAAAEWLFL